MHELRDTPFGRYRLLEPIGQGSLTEVFRAKSFGVEGFEKTLVIKRLRAELAQDSGFVARFIEQGKLAVRLSHANVAQVVDLGWVEQNGAHSYFLASEWVAGLDLANLLAALLDADEQAPLGCVLYVACEIAKALDHAHRRRDERLESLRIVHGGLSPSNVLLSWDGDVKVSDFCLARALAPGRISRSVARYGSPEQLAGQVATAQSDLFSLGCMLYELFVGAHPLGKSSSRNAVAAPLRERRPDLDPRLATLVERLLERRPEARPSSAGELYEQLLAHGYGSGVSFGPEELSDVTTRFRAAPSIAPLAGFDDALLQSLPPGPPAAQDTARVRASSPAPSPVRPFRDLANLRDVSGLVLSFAGAPPMPPVRARAKQIVERYGGYLVEDGQRRLAAVFGLSEIDGRDTEIAVRCGLVLVRSLVSGAAEPSVGIAVGRLHLGEDRRLMYDATARRFFDGATRLSELAPGRVTIAEDAHRNLRDRFTLDLPPADKPDAAAFLVGDVRPLHDVAGRFVGRKRELRALGERLAHAARGQLHVLGVVGDQGLGKTRLLLEMQRRLERGAFNIGFYVASCPPRGRELPHSALIAMLRTLCGVREWDSQAHIDAVEPRLRALGLHDEEVQAVLARLGAQRVAGADGRGGALRAAVSRMFGSLAADRLHVFAWDDSQEMDDQSVEVMRAASERLRDARAVLLFTGRPERTSFRTLPAYEELVVGDLEEEDALRLVALRLEADEVPERLLQFVRRRAGGHPMFIEELLHEALDSGAVVVQYGQVRGFDLEGALAVPRPLRTLLTDRVRRLDDASRRLLIAAAVLGAPADLAVLSHMLHEPLGTLIEGLEAQEFLERAGPVAVSFRSPLVQEVLLAQIEPDALVELHQQAALAYEALLDERGEAELPRLAHHLAESGAHDRAAGVFARSGLDALGAHRFERALTWLSRGLTLADLEKHDTQEIAAWTAALAEVVQRVRRAPAVPALVQRLEAYCEALPGGEPSNRVRILLDGARMLGTLHRYKEARRVLASARRQARNAPELAWPALMIEAEIANHVGDFRLAVSLLEATSRLPAPDEREQHRLLVAGAQALGGAGDHVRALAVLEQASELAPPEDVALACERAKVRATIFGFSRDWRACALAAAEAAEQGRAAGLLYEVAVNRHNQGEALLRGGELPRAYAALQASLAVADEIGADRIANLNTLMLAYLDALGGSEAARGRLGERLAHAEAQNFTWDVLTGRYLLGKLLAQTGDLPGARRELELARKMAEQTGNALLLGDCNEELGRLEVAR
jgi:serine/threonine protein kinase/tetratricopeptide (TPR) repeat protein